MRIDDEKFLSRFKSNFEKLFPDSTTFNEIISVIADNKLSIERDSTDISIQIKNESIKEIGKTLPFLLKITEKPHSFIKTYEEKTLVATAKRINSKAISYLSRNSNDWFARTFLTVIPKNILSDINEETFNLYENRFIVTLIDRILGIIIKERIEIEKINDRITNDRIQSKLAERGYIRMQSNSNELSKKLLRNKQDSLTSDTSYYIINDYFDKIKSLENMIKYMKQSRLYSELKKCRCVQNPIQKTNILIFDPRYNAAYKLWEYLDNIIPNETIAIDETTVQSLPLCYDLFVLVTLIGALKDLGFSITQDSNLKFQNNLLSLNGLSIWKKKADIMQLCYQNNKIELNYCIDSTKSIWDKIAITPDFSVDFENKSLIEVREQADTIVNGLALHQNNKHEQISNFHFISMDIHHCSDNSDWGEMIYRRFFNIGDNYSNYEKNISKLSFYQSGILIISPDNFQINFLRIQRLINSMVLRNRTKVLSNCPICGDENITRLNDKEIICNACLHYISFSNCKNTDCNTEFLWIKYRDDKFLNDSIINKNFETERYYTKIIRCEALMKEYAITSFSIEKDNSGAWKLKSLCPKCGRKLGDSQKQNDVV